MKGPWTEDPRALLYFFRAHTETLYIIRCLSLILCVSVSLCEYSIAGGRRVVKVGINFSSKERTIEEWKVKC